jgi:hypothetical protein
MTGSIAAGTHTKELLPLDQLTAQRAAGRVFVGFREPPVTFRPTFKVRGTTSTCLYWVGVLSTLGPCTAQGTASCIMQCMRHPVCGLCVAPMLQPPSC